MAIITRYPSSNSVGTTGWTNPANVYADDGVYATCAPAKSATISSYFSGFDFSAIGDTDTINSVTLYCKYHVDTQASIADIALRIYDNTTQIGTVDLTNNTEPLADTVYSLAISPTLAQLKSSTFRIRASGHRGNNTNAVTLYLDCIYVVVDYTPAATGYTLTTEKGTFSLTGQSAQLKIGRKLLMSGGVYNLTGKNAIPKVGRKLTAERGTITLIYPNAILKVTRKLGAVGSLINLTGYDALLTKGDSLNHYTLPCQTGNITLTLTPTALKISRRLSCQSSTFVVVRYSVGLIQHRVIHTERGTFAITGYSVVMGEQTPSIKIRNDGHLYGIVGGVIQIGLWTKRNL